MNSRTIRYYHIESAGQSQNKKVSFHSGVLSVLIMAFIICVSNHICAEESYEITSDTGIEHVSAQPNITTFLTPEEQLWLSQYNGQIRIGITVIPPQILQIKGEYKGLSVDYISLIERKLGCRFELIPYTTWNEVIQAAKMRQIDMIFAAQQTPERLTYLLFTDPYIELPNMILVRRDRQGQYALQDMKGWTVATSEGSAVHEYLKREFSDLDLKPVPDELTGLTKVSMGEVDAMVVEISRASYYIEQKGIMNLRVAGEAGLLYQLRFAIRNDWPILCDILDKGLSAITEQERREINRRWIIVESKSVFRSGRFQISVAVAAGIILLVIAAIIVWNYSLRMLVRQRTFQLQEELAEREKAEKELQKSKDLLNASQHLAKVGGWEYNVISGQSSWSEELYRLHEIPNDPTIDHIKESLNCYCPEDQPIISEAFKNACEKGESYDLEFPFTTHKGKHLWIRTVAQPVYEEGKVVRLIGNLMDTTEHKQMYEAVQTSQERLLLAVEASQMGLWDWNIITGDVIWSDQCKAHYGFSPETSMSYELFLQALHPDDRERIDAALKRAVEEGKNYDETKRIIWPDGSIHWTSSRGRVYYDAKGKPVRMVGVTFDITERKLAEAKLLESEERFRSLVTQAVDAFYLLDHKGWILDVNQAACISLGYSREELLSLNIADVDTEVESNRHKERFWDTLQPGKPATFEGLHRRKDGSTFPVEVRLGIFELGNDKYMLGLARDITDRKQMEVERQNHLRFLESMDKINRAIQGANDLETMMSDVLDTVLSIFDCDRAFLMYPCDPEATSWTAPMERTRPEYPGVLALGLDIPMDADVAQTLRLLLDSEGPVKFGPDTPHPLPEEVSKRFGFKCFMSMALYPKEGMPWQFGIHQCSYARKWSPEEERLLLGIGRRLADSLTTFLANQKLQKSEQRFRRMFENSPVSIWEEDFSEVKSFLDELKTQGIVDLESYFQQHPEAVRQCTERVKVLDVNRAALTLHGAVNKEELVAGLVNMFTPESFETFRQELVCLWNGGTEMSADAIVKTLASNPRYVTIYFSVCPGHEETLSRVLVSLTDITERKQNEEVNAIRLHLIQFSYTHTLDELLEETLNKVEELTGSLIGFYHFVEEDQKTLSLQNWSTRTKTTFCKAEGKGLHYPIEQAGVWVDCVYQRKAVIHNDYASLPHRKGMPEGHAVVIRELVVPVFRGKKIVAILGVGNKPDDYTEKDVEIVSLIADLAWEIAERKRAEEEIRKLNQELEARVARRTVQLKAANKELEAFAYSVSHDLRAPLRGIDGFSQILLEEYLDKMDKQGGDYLRRVRAATQQMGRLIDNLLNLSRVSRSDMEIQQVDLTGIAWEIAEKLRQSEPERQVEFVIQDGIQAQADIRLIQIVVDNLFQNAWKFTSKHPVARIEFGIQQHNQMSVYFVRDDGAGFDMNYAQKLFGAFQRLHTASEFPGTGIGLATVQRIIYRHGGKVWAEGEVEKGATVYFTIS